MAEVLLLHHVCGLTAGVVALADDWRAAGHTVHTPDLFDGRVFASIEAGAAHVASLEPRALTDRVDRAAEALPPGVVHAGISIGAVQAQRLATVRSGARGALLLEAFAGPERFGSWPPGVPAQIHGMDDDAFFAHEGDLEHAAALAAARDDVELCTYPGSAHLFEDRSLDAYDHEAAALLRQRAADFLRRV